MTATLEPTTDDPVPEVADATRSRVATIRRLARRPGFVVGIAGVALWTFMALFGRTVAPYDPDRTGVGLPLEDPSLAHWAGTDDLGRDVFSRVLAGAADVLAIAPLATALGVLAGVVLGITAGFRRGLIDAFAMRAADLVIAFPFAILAVLVVSTLGPSRPTLIVLIAVVYAPLVSRTVRTATLNVAQSEYIAAARMRGEGSAYIAIREILPNIAPTILVEATVRLGFAVFMAAGLAFLGLSLQPPSADWGLTVYTQRINLQVAPWTVLAPAFALASLVVAVNLIADVLREELDTP